MVFFLQYSVKIKQRTMAKLEKMAAREERRARMAEAKLEEDTLAFEEFLRANDKSSVEALKLLVTIMFFYSTADCSGHIWSVTSKVHCLVPSPFLPSKKPSENHCRKWTLSLLPKCFPFLCARCVS